MPIGLTTAVIGGAVIGAGASIYAGSKSASAQKKAAQTASDTSLQVANENNALAREFYAANEGHLTPYIDRGNTAGDALMEMLLGPAPTTSGGAPPSTGGSGSGSGSGSGTGTTSGGGSGSSSSGYSGPSLQQIMGMANDGQSGNGQAAINAYMAYYQAHPNEDPGFSSAAMFANDGYKGTAALAQSVLAARQSYLAAHPAAPAAPASFSPAAVTTAAPTSAPATTSALAATGAGTTMVPLDQRIGARPTYADYGSNQVSALQAWARGGDPSALLSPGFGGETVGGEAGAPTGSGGTGSAPPPATGGTGTPPATGTGSTGTPSALSGFDAFQKSASYLTPLNAGLAATAGKYAANGAFESGAEKLAIDRYASDYASNALSGWMNMLYQQEALGAQSASALAGVGTNLVSQISANNTNAGNAAANAALANGQATANQWNNVGSAVSGAAGQIGGALGSSYGSNPAYVNVGTAAPLPSMPSTIGGAVAALPGWGY